VKVLSKKKVKVSNEKSEYNKVIDDLGVAVYVCDKNLKTIFWNKEAERLFGLPKDEVIGKYCYEYTRYNVTKPACHTPNCSSVIVLEGKEGHVVRHVEIQHAGGEWVPVEIHTTPFKDAKGNIIGVIKVALDRREQVAREKEIKEALAKNEAIIKALPDAIFMVNTDREIIYWSEQAEKLTSYSKEEALKRKGFEIWGMDGECKVCEAAMQAMKTQQPVYNVETVFVTKDGKEIPITVNAAPLMGSEGNLEGAVCAVRDITELKKKEEEMREVVDYLHKLPTPVIVIDREFNVKFMNKYGAKLLGKTVEECVGKKCYDLFDTLHCRTDECRVKQAMERDGVFTGETIARGIGNLPIHYTGAPIKDANGNIIGGLEYVADITELKKKEEEMKQMLEYLNAQSEKIGEALKAIADGDLTVRLEKEKDDAVGEIIDALNLTVDSLRALVDNVRESSTQVSTTSEELAASSQQMNASTEQISSTAQQIATAAQNQSKQVGEILNEIKKLKEMSISIAENAAEAVKLSSKTNEAARKGGDAAAEASDKIGKINVVVGEAAEVISELEERSKQIGKIVDLITNIADQTNLLALNAAIEAARAGEHGRGFAVVAEEVRKLAEESRKAAEQIGDLIRSIQSETTKAVDSMNRGTKEVEEGVTMVNNVLAVLEQIIEAANKVSAMIGEISAATQEQQAAAENITKSAEEISASAEEAAAATEEASAAAQELTAGMQELTASAQELTNIANKLQETIEAFKVEITTSAASGHKFKGEKKALATNGGKK